VSGSGSIPASQKDSTPFAYPYAELPFIACVILTP
jgi:hypothetical protein